MTQLRGYLSVTSTPLGTPSGRFRAMNITVFLPPDYDPQRASDVSLLSRMLWFGSAIRKPLVVDFQMVRDALNGEPSYESVLKALQNLYGEQVEVKSREERIHNLQEDERRAREEMKRGTP